MFYSGPSERSIIAAPTGKMCSSSETELLSLHLDAECITPVAVRNRADIQLSSAPVRSGRQLLEAHAVAAPLTPTRFFTMRAWRRRPHVIAGKLINTKESRVSGSTV